MASLKVLSDRNQYLQQIWILDEYLVRPRCLATFLDYEVITLPLFGGHLIDWNLGVRPNVPKSEFSDISFSFRDLTSKHDPFCYSGGLLWGRRGLVVQWNSPAPDDTRDEHIRADHVKNFGQGPVRKVLLRGIVGLVGGLDQLHDFICKSECNLFCLCETACFDVSCF